MMNDPSRPCNDGKGGIIILYESKYGSTQRYAEWIAQAVGGDVCRISSFDPARLGQYKTAVLGSSAYFGRIRCRKFLKNNWSVLREKQTIVFGVTGIPLDDPRQQLIFKRSFPLPIRNAISYYPLRGAFCYRRLKCIDKILMSGPKVRLQIRWWLTRDTKAKELLQRFGAPMDWTSRSAVDAMCLSLGLKVMDPDRKTDTQHEALHEN